MTKPIIFHEASAHNAEKAMLGAILINPDTFPAVREYVQSVDYIADETHQAIFSAMVRLWSTNGTIDGAVLLDSLMQRGGYENGMASYMAELVTSTPTSDNAEIYARSVLEAHLLRTLSAEARLLANDAGQQAVSIEEIRERAQAMTEQICRRVDRERVQSADELADAAMAEIERMIEAGGVIGVKTGFSQYDAMTGGLQAGMHVVGARPSVGKTAFALNVARNVAVQYRQRVLVVSLEMSAQALMKRLMFMEGGVDAERLAAGFLAKQERAKLGPARDRLRVAPLEVVQASNLTPMKLRRIMQRYTEREPVSIVIVDYLQLMNGDEKTDNRAIEMAAVSRSIKLLSGEFNVPIMALAQVNRDADEGAPRLKHLRESGSIEQDADTVLFLHPEKDSNALMAVLAKQRDGRQGAFPIAFNKPTQRMGDSVGVVEPPSAPHSEDYYQDGDDPF